MHTLRAMQQSIWLFAMSIQTIINYSITCWPAGGRGPLDGHSGTCRSGPAAGGRPGTARKARRTVGVARSGGWRFWLMGMDQIEEWLKCTCMHGISFSNRLATHMAQVMELAPVRLAPIGEPDLRLHQLKIKVGVEALHEGGNAHVPLLCALHVGRQVGQ